jgi:hypothetical protein
MASPRRGIAHQGARLHPNKENQMKSLSKTMLIAIGSAAMLLGVQASYAGFHDPGVNHRQHHQHHRIKQGVRSGELTHSEARGLRQEQRQIRTEERAYKSDGKLDRAERKDLHQDLNQASKNIYQDKHNAETR